MPELPEVETIKRALEKGIGLAQILSVKINNPRLRIIIPNDLPEKIIQTTIYQYTRIAKYIVIRLDNDYSLLWHMGMSGKIKISDHFPENQDKHDHIIIETSAGYITYNDPRRFGLFTICETKNLNNNSFLRNVGIDPFDDELTPQYLYDKLQKKVKTPIKIALLDQTIISGIGNIYASEILYESRILPTRLCNDISVGDCALLVKNTRKVLLKAIDAGGSTLKDYKKPDGSLGYFQNLHCVYNKTGQKCPDCICDVKITGGIQKSVMGGRSTFYCKGLQK